MKFRHIVASALTSLAAVSALATPLVTPQYTTTGINMLGEIGASDYTLDMTFKLDDLSGWRKVVDFKNRTDDAGLYLYWDQLSFATSSGDIFATTNTAGSTLGTRVTLTRDNTGLVNAYVNGALQISFNDTTNSAVFGTSGGQTSAWLLADDMLFGSREQPSGTLSSVKVYDHALSPREVAAVPEPEALALAAAGVLAAVTLRRRRQA